MEFLEADARKKNDFEFFRGLRSTKSSGKNSFLNSSEEFWWSRLA